MLIALNPCRQSSAVLRFLAGHQFKWVWFLDIPFSLFHVCAIQCAQGFSPLRSIQPWSSSREVLVNTHPTTNLDFFSLSLPQSSRDSGIKSKAFDRLFDVCGKHSSR